MLTLAELGLTQEELRERVIDKMAEQLLGEKSFDEDGYATVSSSHLKQQLEKKIVSHVEATIAHLADVHVLPSVSRYIEDLTLQETTKWGEKKGAPMTFREYMVHRAESYLREEVNFEGKTKAENGSYSFSGAQTRITHLVHRHLHYTIESAMKEAVNNINKVMGEALAETCKIQLKNIAASLKVNVMTKGA